MNLSWAQTELIIGKRCCHFSPSASFRRVHTRLWIFTCRREIRIAESQSTARGGDVFALHYSWMIECKRLSSSSARQSVQYLQWSLFTVHWAGENPNAETIEEPNKSASMDSRSPVTVSTFLHWIAHAAPKVNLDFLRQMNHNETVCWPRSDEYQTLSSPAANGLPALLSISLGMQ